jgi:hypothetical protein
MQCPNCGNELEWHNIVTRKKDGFLLAEVYRCIRGVAFANDEQEAYEFSEEDYCSSAEFGGTMYWNGDGDFFEGNQNFT